jgi:hypothetical protein
MNGLNAFERQYRTTGTGTMIAQSVADILSHYVKLSVEGIDPMYLNIDVPQLQREQGIVWFFRGHRGLPVPSAAVMRLRERCRRRRSLGRSRPALDKSPLSKMQFSGVG